MGIPVKLKNDDFVYMGEAFDKGDIFDAPHEALVSYMCDQENTATRVDESKLEPAVGNTMKRVMKGGYNTKVMTPDSESKTPIQTKNAPNKRRAKSSVKAPANATAENS